MTAMGTDWRKDVVGGDESLGLPGGDDPLLHRVIGDGDRLGLRGKGDLKPIDSKKDSSGGVRNHVVGDERSLSTPNLRLVKDVNSLLQMFLHRSRIGGVPTSELLHRDGKEGSVKVEGLIRHVHEHTKTDLGDGVEDTRVNAVPFPVDVRSAFWNIESSDVSLIGPTSRVRDGVKFLGVVTEVVLIVVAGWEVLVELVAGHADKRRGHEGSDIESREVLWIVVGVLALEVTASVDSLENHLAIGILAVGGAAEFPVVTIDDNSSVAGGSVMSIENEGFEDLHVFDNESTVLKDGFGITARNVRGKFSIQRGR